MPCAVTLSLTLITIGEKDNAWNPGGPLRTGMNLVMIGGDRVWLRVLLRMFLNLLPKSSFWPVVG